MNNFYENYLASPVWKEKGRKRLTIDKYECRGCGRGGEEVYIQVHHKPQSYEKLGFESVEDDLTTFCETCHEAITSIVRELRYEKREMETEDVEQLAFTHRKGDNYAMGEDVIRDSRNSTVDYAQYQNVRSQESNSKRDCQDNEEESED